MFHCFCLFEDGSFYAPQTNPECPEGKMYYYVALDRIKLSLFEHT